MQGAGPPGGHNPFGPPGQNPFNAYNVNTTAQFADEVVPAVPPPPPPAPAGPPPAGTFAPSYQGAWNAPPAQAAGYEPQHVTLQFTDTTAPQYVSGNIQRGDERQNLVVGPGRSDDPGFTSPSGAPGGSFSQPLNPGTEERPKEDYTKYPFYNVRRYREYFDVDTKDVLWRVSNSMIGVFRPNFIEVTMKNPDLYGPFWTATTLIFITAVAGNFVDYIQWRRERSTPSPPPPASPALLAPSDNPGRLLLASSSDANSNQWYNDYTKLGTSAAIFYGYVFIIGLLLFFVVKWFKGELRLANVFCIYGYSLSIFVPVSIACVVPIVWLQWLLVMLATALSAGFLFMNFRATIYSAAPARAVLVLLLIVLAHIGLGLGLKLYFFSY